VRVFAAITVAALALMQGSIASACVGLTYDGAEFTPAFAADQMVAEAATIELMRVVSRTSVKSDLGYAEYYVGGPYSFRLETIEVLKGFRRDAFDVYGFASDTHPRYMPEYRFRGREPLWWSGTQGYVGLQETVMLDPADSGSMACASPLIFDVGAEYLVFRNSRGELLSPAYRRTERPANPPQRPVIEEIHGSSDPWMTHVRQAIADQGVRPATVWDAIFALIFGDRRTTRR